jgi:integrase
MDRDGHTVREAVEDWLEYGLGRQAPSTIEKYRILCSKHIIPLLGARKLRDLTTREVEAWLRKLFKSLSTETLRRTHACLNRAVRRAAARDWVKRNVVDLAELPAGRDGRPSKSLTPEQVDAVLTATASHRMHNYIVLSLLTGARTEELRALRWQHVHLGDVADPEQTTPPHVEVWRSVRVGGDTKTRRSRRTLALPSRCVDALGNQHDRQAAERASVGARWQDHGLVFPSSVGTPMSAGNARRSFRNALKLVPDLNPMEWTPRELRHSFVSLLSDAGVPLEEISRLVGHAGTTVAELVYRHQLKPVIQTGATVMDRLFGTETESVVTQLVTQDLDDYESWE